MRADANDKMGEVKARIEKRNREMDADMAAGDADWAEPDAVEALDYAAWTLDNARVAMLDAIDARAYATARASGAHASPGRGGTARMPRARCSARPGPRAGRGPSR